LVPLTPETRGIVGATQIAAMKAGTCIINIARGGCIDEYALARALAG
jgi:phosphoglycerate dehydrogenase-like enzyme